MSFNCNHRSDWSPLLELIPTSWVMPGFDISRIVGLDAKYAKTLECAICLLILDNPIITDCGHNYCYECLQYFVENGSDGCPKCRKKFSMKLSNRSSNDDNCVVIYRNRMSYVFVRNLTLSEIISKLKINCDFEFNGCQKSLELGLLSGHLKECEHRLCKKCDFAYDSGKVDEHNCLELLKNDLKKWKTRFEESQQTVKGLKIENSKLRTDFHKSVSACDQWKEKCDKYEQIVDSINRKRSQSLRRGKSCDDGYVRRSLFRRAIDRFAAKSPMVEAIECKPEETKKEKSGGTDLVVDINVVEDDTRADSVVDNGVISCEDQSQTSVNLPDECDSSQSSMTQPLVAIEMNVSVWVKS